MNMILPPTRCRLGRCSESTGGLDAPHLILYTLEVNHTHPMRIEIRFQTPYNHTEWRSQWFPTLEEAQRMVDFYLSCGSPAHVAPSSLAQFDR